MSATYTCLYNNSLVALRASGAHQQVVKASPVRGSVIRLQRRSPGHCHIRIQCALAADPKQVVQHQHQQSSLAPAAPSVAALFRWPAAFGSQAVSLFGAHL